MLKKQTHLLLALDAVHVDTGEMQIGRVDNFILRDPADGCPKIPGSSLHGAIRHNAARYATTHLDRKYINCAGQIQPEEEHDKNCPICWTFGRPPAEDDHTSGNRGRVSIYDARITFFPVNTMYGLVYVTTPHLLKWIGLSTDPPIDEQVTFLRAYRTDSHPLPINLGKLMFYQSQVRSCTIRSKLSFQNGDQRLANFLQDRLYIVDETSFVSIINANLDVRTSVSIKPEEGTVDLGPFVSESIPRGAILGFDLGWETEGFPRWIGAGSTIGSWQNALDLVATGLEMIEVLGVGGVVTRGMGRLKWLKRSEEGMQ